jgi:two-component system response regulator YesN
MVRAVYKVLLVDDETINYQLFEKLVNWKENGFQIVGTASDGLEALQQYEKLEPDLIFMDIQLPLMDGLECVRCIREENKEVQIVIVSAYGDFSYAQKAIRYGVQDFLLKPVSRIMLNQLVQKMHGVLEARQKMNAQGTEKNYFENEVAKHLRELLRMQPENGNIEKCSEVLKEKGICGVVLIDDAGKMLSGDRWKEIMNQIIQSEAVKDVVQAIVLAGAGHTLLCGNAKIYAERFTDSLWECLGQSGCKFQIYRADNGQTDIYRWIQKFISVENYGFYDENSGKYNLYEEPYTEKEMDVSNLDYKIVKAIVDHSCQEITDWLEERFAGAKAEKISPAVLKDFSLDILVRIKFALKNLDQRESFPLMRNIRIENIHQLQDYVRLLKFVRAKIENTFRNIEEDLVGKESSLVFRANAFTALYYCDVSFSVQKVADYIGISKNYFTSLYKEQSGTGFWEYVTKLRMKRAVDWLLTSEETVGNIGRNVGYESEYHFSRKFKEYMGDSPNRYRKNHSNQQKP